MYKDVVGELQRWIYYRQPQASTNLPLAAPPLPGAQYLIGQSSQGSRTPSTPPSVPGIVAPPPEVPELLGSSYPSEMHPARQWRAPSPFQNLNFSGNSSQRPAVPMQQPWKQGSPPLETRTIPTSGPIQNVIASSQQPGLMPQDVSVQIGHMATKQAFSGQITLNNPTFNL